MERVYHNHCGSLIFLFTHLASISGENTFCAWCRSTEGAENFSVKMTNSDKMFCSEICFTHYRRVNFRRSKTCDWCRHVRHAVNYVNLQDGDNRYQFCR